MVASGFQETYAKSTRGFANLRAYSQSAEGPVHCSLTKTDAGIVLLFNYRVGHGTVLLGLYVSQENGGVALQKNFNDEEIALRL
jgi:hypothetical protein